MALLDTFAKARADGVNTPQVAFMLNFAGNSNSKTQLIELYDKIYSKNLYRDLWFMWEGKPLIMAYPEAMDQASPAASSDEVNTIKSFFTFRRNEPTYFASDKTYSKKTWGWCSVYPQTKFGVRSDGSVEQMTVSVAQNATDTQLIAMNAPVAGVHGRSYTKGSYSYTYKKYGQSNVTVSKSIADSMLYGLNFQQQWDYALKVDPDFIFVTGWNEWVAGRHAEWLGTENAFPDQFSEEYSRDIEPAKGPLGDNYYYQLVENIRRFKGVTSGKFAVAEKTIDINAGASAWSNVTSSYDDYVDYKDGRNRTGYQGTRYKADKVRNDIIHSKFAYDSENLYFMVQTVNNITAYTDTNWMRLLISVDGGSSNGWEGFNFIVNRNNPTAAAAKVEKFNGGWKFSTAGSAKYSVKGNTMTIAIPKSVLGISASGKLPVINFKWVDNAISAADGDILDVYTYGDAAPDARFTYRVDIQDGVQKLGASSGTASSVPTPTAPAAAKPRRLLRQFQPRRLPLM